MKFGSNVNWMCMNIHVLQSEILIPFGLLFFVKKALTMHTL